MLRHQTMLCWSKWIRLLTSNQSDTGSSPVQSAKQVINMDRNLNKRFAICFPSGTILFTTNDEQTAQNRKAFGWTIVHL